MLITENAKDFGLIRQYLPHHALSMGELARALPAR
ncbi:uncharacterized protein SOCE26_092580 [Sorangium cellulosum]|uniref:Uncharacterized protein n=1 Tax=Sorangium cellulosum TaxID=56 RepID=A0A2L0F802_SORCE|nr:uncharacterized protein SOCE26_092580 [Sorangium cellulosum]